MNRIIIYAVVFALALVGATEWIALQHERNKHELADDWSRDDMVDRFSAMYYLHGQQDAIVQIRTDEHFLEKIKEARDQFVINCSLDSNELDCRERWLSIQPHLLRQEVLQRQAKKNQQSRIEA